ncbi:hypothetical protein [Thermotalea metallivorans]|uniref:Uncharacterized protein n=1 Tax=Thermotalea metallivorans TaxID=520762 RepID=A0A140L5W5_9FIRM|nr:hypothetical protein [Thermotalea metallivorans]KXG75940.1 hypothetical protein AN619_14030 [Thermotalea metallivorans]
MRKILSLILAVVFVFSNIAGVSAESSDKDTQIDNKEVVHKLGGSSGDVTIQGINPPPAGNPWLLNSGAYNFSFQFDSNLYQNTTMKTSTGTISFTLTSKSDWIHTTNTTFEFKLYKKGLFGDTLIGSRTCARDGKSTGSFTGLDTKAEYYFMLSKATDGVILSGSGSIKQ